MKIPDILDGTTPKGEWDIRYFISRVRPRLSAAMPAAAAATYSHSCPINDDYDDDDEGGRGGRSK